MTEPTNEWTRAGRWTKARKMAFSRTAGGAAEPQPGRGLGGSRGPSWRTARAGQKPSNMAGSRTPGPEPAPCEAGEPGSREPGRPEARPDRDTQPAGSRTRWAPRPPAALRRGRPRSTPAPPAWLEPGQPHPPPALTGKLRTLGLASARASLGGPHASRTGRPGRPEGTRASSAGMRSGCSGQRSRGRWQGGAGVRTQRGCV